jgi:hypothetical protein
MLPNKIAIVERSGKGNMLLLTYAQHACPWQWYNTNTICERNILK